MKTSKTPTRTTKIEPITIRKRKEKPTLTQQIDMFRALVRSVARSTGGKEMQLICSPPGLGKTTIVTQELKKLGIKVKCHNPANVFAFRDALYEDRNQPVIVFDDSERLLASEQIMNIAKQAFGPKHLVVLQTRESQKYEKERKRRANEEPEDYENRLARLAERPVVPTQFKIKCRLIMLSNLDYTKKETVKEHLQSHFEALVSRGLHPYWIETTGSPQKDLEMFLYTLNLAPKMLSDHGFNLETSQLAIKWFIEYRNEIKELCPRTVIQAANQFKGIEPNKAEELLETLLSAQRNLPDVEAPKFIRQNEWTLVTVKKIAAPTTASKLAAAKQAGRKPATEKIKATTAAKRKGLNKKPAAKPTKTTTTRAMKRKSVKK